MFYIDLTHSHPSVALIDAQFLCQWLSLPFSFYGPSVCVPAVFQMFVAVGTLRMPLQLPLSPPKLAVGGGFRCSVIPPEPPEISQFVNSRLKSHSIKESTWSALNQQNLLPLWCWYICWKQNNWKVCHYETVPNYYEILSH